MANTRRHLCAALVEPRHSGACTSQLRKNVTKKCGVQALVPLHWRQNSTRYREGMNKEMESSYTHTLRLFAWKSDVWNEHKHLSHAHTNTCLDIIDSHACLYMLRETQQNSRICHTRSIAIVRDWALLLGNSSHNTAICGK